VVDTGARVVMHHHRDEAGDVGIRFLREGKLSFDPPGLAIEIADLFASL
jgi:hypothetical protein